MEKLYEDNLNINPNYKLNIDKKKAEKIFEIFFNSILFDKYAFSLPSLLIHL